MSKKSRPSIPQKMLSVYEAVTAWTDSFCQANVSDEYASVARDMTAALARKRPSPLLQGQSKSWACGIVLALGRVNFLFDPSQEPHVTVADFCKLFGVSQSTAFAKASQVEKALKICSMDTRWTLPSKMDDNPLAWLIEVNGIVVDVRMLPGDTQEMLFRAGLIPRLPSTEDE
ncbi:MAG: DUF6398 domain-containing protein [Pseudomonadota bacterium]